MMRCIEFDSFLRFGEIGCHHLATLYAGESFEIPYRIAVEAGVQTTS
jgi:hypothetical protein